MKKKKNNCSYNITNFVDLIILKFTKMYPSIKLFTAHQSKYVLIISFMLSVVPITNPANPINPMMTFFVTIIVLVWPDVVFHLPTHSKNAGNKMPDVDSVNAPTKLMIKSKFGIKTPRMTANVNKNKFKQIIQQVRVSHSPKTVFHSNEGQNEIQSIWKWNLHVMKTITVRITYSQNNCRRLFFTIFEMYCVQMISIET